MSSQLLASLEKEFGRYFLDSSGDSKDDGATYVVQDTHLDQIHSETIKFKTNLRKLKAHLNKNLEESSNNRDDDGNIDYKSKKRDLIIEKLNKSHKVWDHHMKKLMKSNSQAHSKFAKHALQKLSEYRIDDVYMNPIPEAYSENVERIINSYMLCYTLQNIPTRGTEEMLKYLKDVYQIDGSVTAEYLELGQICQDILSGKTDSALAWCEGALNSSSTSMDLSDLNQNNQVREQLEFLKFELFTLSALEVYAEGDCIRTYKYVQQNIPASFYQLKKYNMIKETILPLLAKVLSQDHIDKSINGTISSQKQKCINIFTRQYCSHKNLPIDSPLFLIILSGIISFRFFIKYKSIRASAHVDWSTKDELPFEVDMPEFLSSFHPIFICPVLKEETTQENPPYSLSCHHVISKKALDKLSTNGTMAFKCPYCPVNSTIANTRKIKFVRL